MLCIIPPMDFRLSHSAHDVDVHDIRSSDTYIGMKLRQVYGKVRLQRIGNRTLYKFSSGRMRLLSALLSLGCFLCGSLSSLLCSGLAATACAACLLGSSLLHHVFIVIHEFDEASLGVVTKAIASLDNTCIATVAVSDLLGYLTEKLSDSILVLEM